MEYELPKSVISSLVDKQVEWRQMWIRDDEISLECSVGLMINWILVNEPHKDIKIPRY